MRLTHSVFDHAQIGAHVARTGYRLRLSLRPVYGMRIRRCRRKFSSALRPEGETMRREEQSSWDGHHLCRRHWTLRLWQGRGKAVLRLWQGHVCRGEGEANEIVGQRPYRPRTRLVQPVLPMVEERCQDGAASCCVCCWCCWPRRRLGCSGVAAARKAAGGKPRQRAVWWLLPWACERTAWPVATAGSLGFLGRTDRQTHRRGIATRGTFFHSSRVSVASGPPHQPPPADQRLAPEVSARLHASHGRLTSLIEAIRATEMSVDAR